MIRLLLVDNQSVVRHGLLMRLALEPDLQVVGTAGTPEEALRLAGVATPDVIVMDIQIRGADGIEVIRQIQHSFPSCSVVVLTLHDDKDTRENALSAGAQAFVEKQGGVETLLGEIRRLAPAARGK